MTGKFGLCMYIIHFNVQIKRVRKVLVAVFEVSDKTCKEINAFLPWVAKTTIQNIYEYALDNCPEQLCWITRLNNPERLPSTIPHGQLP